MPAPVPSAEMTVAETLARWPELAEVFCRHRMACVGCAMARFDRLSDAARVYGRSPARFLGALRQALRRKAAAS